jgi:hypothetical protein
MVRSPHARFEDLSPEEGRIAVTAAATAEGGIYVVGGRRARNRQMLCWREIPALALAVVAATASPASIIHSFLQERRDRDLVQSN